MTFTIKELAEMFNIAYPEAQGLVKGLAALHYLKPIGTQKTPSGRGKGSTVYEITFDRCEVDVMRAINDSLIAKRKEEAPDVE